MAKDNTPKTVLERTYTIPLRREYLKVANWRRTEKAVTAVKEFLTRHMKSKDVKIEKSVNDELWKHGIKNPPHHIKIIAKKDEKGQVRAELFGAKPVKKAETKPEAPQKEDPAITAPAVSKEIAPKPRKKALPQKM